ncbi:MAG: DUF3037 domain-containing protein [Acidobacteriota bacterium]|nr:DUF3037 domain-containing protein [Acidobacteriota bacterium]
MNVGVIVFSPQARYLRLRVETRYERLTHAFSQFDGTSFRRAVANLFASFRTAEREIADRPLFNNDQSLLDWLNSVVPDRSTSLSVGSVRHGVTSDLDKETELLFDRMVQSQKGQSDESPRRDDAQVWNGFVRQLPSEVRRQLTPRAFATSKLKITFDHAVKNGKWHVVQPVSMDFKRPESMQRKASQWVGTAVGLRDAEELGTIYFLLGRPSNETKAYERAKSLLDAAPIPHKIVEEDEALALGQTLLDLLSHEGH